MTDREVYLAAARKRSADRRASFTAEERAAMLRYLSEYGKRNRVRLSTRRRLWRAERLLAEAWGTNDPELIQKRRVELAMVCELINIFGAW